MMEKFRAAGSLATEAAKQLPGSLAAAGTMVKTYATEQTPKAAHEASQYAVKHPVVTAGVAIGVGVCLVPTALTAPLLGGLGFVPSVAKLSYAATFHSFVGNPVAGGVFATIQSAGAGGYGVAVVNGVASAAGGAVAAGSAVVGYVKSKL